MSIFSHTFEAPEDGDKAILLKYFDGYNYRGASYTYIANYIWRRSYCLCWEIIEGYLCMAGGNCAGDGSDSVISMPLTAVGSYDIDNLRKAILECKKRFDARNINFEIIAIPEHMVKFLEEAFGDKIEVFADRDADEYVYLKDKLISLSGRALHKKKNHMNYFLKNFEYEVRPITLDMRDEVLQFTKEQKQNKEADEQIETLESELDAIGQILRLVDMPNVYSTAIYINDKLEGFAVGELISDEMAVEHFEKANDSFRGIYQIVCREFCKQLPESVKYVNREEDMGLENLRQAKEALKPEYMEKRFYATLKI
ncbi:MAG: phosphatidylglycerol lysyltransferase domain-containing protein [Eubacterium sp.]|nr:phosphatidylglycerol lysyltransferase domain-containing protein [Eubacterium sp.]